MSSSLASPQQVRAIQTARRGAGLKDEDAYRAALSGFGVSSTKALTRDQAYAFLERLNGGRGGVEASSKDRVAGPFGPKLQALWVSAWNLGMVEAGDVGALHAFVKRQTGIAHTRFLRDPLEAERVIEGVKAMCARAGVAWPSKPGPGAIALKRAVVAAQFRLLADRGLYPEGGAFAGLSAPELDGLSAQLGSNIREALHG